MFELLVDRILCIDITFKFQINDLFLQPERADPAMKIHEELL